jgi:hypothetical protein
MSSSPLLLFHISVATVGLLSGAAAMSFRKGRSLHRDLGVEAASSPTGSKDGVPAVGYFVLGSVALLSAAGDVRMLVRGGIFGVQRIGRHLWRMCFALFIACGSIFLARPQIFPAVLRETHALVLLGILPLILMIFWLVRVRLTNTYKRTSMAGRGRVYSLPT